MSRHRVLAAGACALAILVAAPARATTLYVASNGVPGVNCGDKTTPCRSLTQAIRQASPGDTIAVGPGRYGDLDGNGLFSPAEGEEDAELDSGCDCMIDVDRPLTIVSRNGAGATVLDAGGANVAVVHIAAPGVVFGKRKQGFTLTRSGDDDGLQTAGRPDWVAVEGNRAVLNGATGFAIDTGGPGTTKVNDNWAGGNAYGIDVRVTTPLTMKNNSAAGNDVIGIAARSATSLAVVANLASGNDDGIVVFAGGPLTLKNNASTNNTDDGFEVRRAIGGIVTGNLANDNGEDGFEVWSPMPDITRVLFKGNVASGNGDDGWDIGPAVTTEITMQGNLGCGNRGVGLEIKGARHMIVKNSFVGNGGAGIDVLRDTSDLTVTKSNLFGNDAAAANCGIRSYASTPVDARGNFWGTPAGPGADPADQACVAGTGVLPLSTPAVTKEIQLKVKAAQ